MNKNVKLDMETTTNTVKIHALSHDGRGIASINNKKAFITGALPDETATYKITRKRSSYVEANADAILTVSPQRSAPPCDHFGICGGCSLQHMNMETQLDLKQETLLNHLKHFGKVEPEAILPSLNASTLGYRRKARLGVKFVFKKNKLLIGFREKASRYLADITQCAVLHPKIGARLTLLSEFISTLQIYDQIPQIEVAIGDEDAVLIFRHMAPFIDSDKEKLIDFGKHQHFQIYLQPNPPASVYKLWPNDQTERITYSLPDYELEYRFHPLDFTQINLEMNRLMIKQAIKLLELKEDETVLDLFCGIGNFTLPIARHAKRVTGIEGSAEMVDRAWENAKHNHIENVEFYAANLTSTTEAAWIKHHDKVLLDPPRTGAKEILPCIKQIKPKKIVYVSCNPATLARDAGELVHEYGYKFRNAGIMNMFPHTTHIEAMAVFEKI